ncbi:MAG TPA: hypothetical protein VMZ91_16250, partial [Candidatus Paceibacterota bacterium]|nr:hypothetical protein [Candidatus Paceibacterota bacterium]
VKHRMKFTINNIEHSAGVVALTTTTATINVSSTPQTAILNIGDTRRFDVTDDNYYDVQATLNSISNNKADITIKSIHEEITVETAAEEQEKETAAAEVKETEEIEARKTALWTLLIIIAVIIIAVIVYLIYKKRKY